MIRASQWLGAYAVICFSLSNMWMELHLASPFCLIALLILMTPWVLPNPMGWPHHAPLHWPAWWQLALGAAASVAPLTYLAITAHQEFPFAGDHDHHWLMTHEMMKVLGWYLAIVLVLAATIVALARRTGWMAWIWLALAWAISTRFPPYEFILRYPAGFYFLAAPLNGLMASAVDPLFANRFLNAIALPMYLFALRPWLVRRWPDARAFLVCAFFLVQKEYTYYLTTTYLEAWALVFALLGTELALSDDERDVELAPALAGVGCMFKEQAVFALALATAAFFWRKRKSWGNLRALMAGGFFFLPFFPYYSARGNAGVFRKVEPSDWSRLLNLDMWSDYALHLQAGLGGAAGIAAMILPTTMALAASVYLRKNWLGWLAIALVFGAELLYLTDKLSTQYLGYPRFHLLSWPLLCVPIWLVFESYPRWRRHMLTAGGVAAVLNLSAALPIFKSALKPDFERNFTEQFYSPLYFPLRQLLALIPSQGPTRSLVINNPVNFLSFPYSLGPAYARELSRFEPKALSPSLVCQCGAANQAIVLIDVFRPEGEALLATPSNLGPGDLRACVESLRRTCGRVQTVDAPDGHIVGAVAFTP